MCVCVYTCNSCFALIPLYVLSLPLSFPPSFPPSLPPSFPPSFLSPSLLPSLPPSSLPPHRLNEVRQEFDEFLQESRELEGELTVQLEQAETSNKDLLSRVQNLEDENETFKVSIS